MSIESLQAELAAIEKAEEEARAAAEAEEKASEQEEIEEAGEEQEEGSQEEQEASTAEQEEDDEEEPSSNRAWKNMREKNKEAQRRADEAERRAQELAERIARLEGRDEARGKPQIDATAEKDNDPEPDKQLDYERWLEWKDRKIEEKVQKLEKQIEQQQLANQFELAKKEVAAIGLQDAKQIGMADYEERLNYVLASRRRELKAAYPKAPDSAIDHQLEVERIGTIHNAKKEGINIAELVREQSEARGYRPSNKKDMLKDEPNIDAINKNMQKSSTFVGKTGDRDKGRKDSKTLEDFASMTPAEILRNPDAWLKYQEELTRERFRVKKEG